MNKLAIILCILGIRSIAQTPAEGLPFKLTPLSFDEIAATMNTMDKKGIPLEFIDGISLDIGLLTEPPYPIEVSFTVDDAIDYKSLELLRWDGSLRRWMSFSGNSITTITSGIEGTVGCTINKEGCYALFRTAKSTGKVEISLPKKHRCAHFRYVQANTGVVMEGKGEGGAIILPINDPSPRATLTMKCQDDKQTPYQLQAPLGKIISICATDIIDRNFNYQLKSKELRLLAAK